MKPKTLVLLAVAAGCGLIAMFGVQQAMTGQRGTAKVPMTKVLVALENIETGMKITADNTAFKELPTSSLQKDSVQTVQQYEERAARVPLTAGDVVRISKLTEPGDWGKSVAIPKGMRVISIPVNDTHTISGLLRPGDRVDVLVTYQGRAERGVRVSKTKTLLEYVEVFNTDDLTASKLDEKSKTARAKNVGLLLSPEQAGYVILAQSKGTLSLSWRRRGDDELAQASEVNEKLMEELQGTVGSRDEEMSLYDHRDPELADQNSENPSVGQFLDQQGQATVPEPVSTPVAPAVPMWTVTVFNGNSQTPQQFEITESTPAGIK